MAYNDNSAQSTDSKLVEKLDKMFRSALDHPTWISGRKNMVKCFQYREGEQWSGPELKELEKRGQPDTVNNQIAITVNKLVGDLTDQKYRIGFRGRNSPNDEGVANALSDIFLYIRQSNDLEFEERDMADDGFTCGFGVMEVFVTFDDMYQPEIKVRSENPLVVFPDPHSRRYDWNEDALFVSRAKWFDIEEAKELYPGKAKELEAAGNSGDTGSVSGQLATVDQFQNDTYVDYQKRRVRIIEVQYKELRREERVLFADGSGSVPKEDAKDLIKQADENGVAYKILDRVNSTIRTGIYAAGILLEDKETDQKYFSLVPYFVYRRKTGEPYSLVTLALSMQDAINKRESKALHLLNTNQVLSEIGSIPDKEKFAEEIAKPDGQPEVAAGALSGQKVVIQRNVELAQSQFTMHVRAQEDLYRITGVDPRIATQTGELRSGTALNQKISTANKPVAPLFENLRRTRKILGRVVLDRVQKYYTPGKVLLITDDDKKSHPLTLDAPLLEKIKTAQYDVIVDDFTDDATVRQEQANLLAQTLPQILPFGPFWTKKFIQLLDFRDKDSLLQEMEEMSAPPPVDPKINVQAQIDKLTPPERAFLWEKMGSPQLAQIVQAMAPTPTDEMKSSVELAKETIRANKPAPTPKGGAA